MESLLVAHERLDEILSGVLFALSRHPEAGVQIYGTSLSIIKTDIYPNAPAIRIFYTYTESEVHLLAIEFANEEDIF